jgi:hypothetical protein
VTLTAEEEPDLAFRSLGAALDPIGARAGELSGKTLTKLSSSTIGRASGIRLCVGARPAICPWRASRGLGTPQPLSRACSRPAEQPGPSCDLQNRSVHEIGQSGLNALSRLFGLLLPAMAIEIIGNGLRSLFPALKPECL